MYKNILKNDLIVATDMEEGEVVCLDVVSGNYYGINDVAKDIWDLLTDIHSENEIVNELIQNYDVDKDTLRDDVRTYLEELKASNLITYDEQ